MIVIGIDPGPEFSALVVWNGSEILEKHYRETDFIVEWLYRKRDNSPEPPMLVIEKVVSYGMAIGESTLGTIYCYGRFAEAYGIQSVHLMPRVEVKKHICHSGAAKDTNIRTSLIDRFGPPGTKKSPGLLYKVTGDLLSALAIAVTWHDAHK